MAGWASFSSHTHVSSMEKRLIHENIINSKNTTLVILSTYLGPGIRTIYIVLYQHIVLLKSCCFIAIGTLIRCFICTKSWLLWWVERARPWQCRHSISVRGPRPRVQVLRKACITKSGGWWSTKSFRPDFADKYQYSFERRHCGVCSLKAEEGQFSTLSDSLMLSFNPSPHPQK